MCPSLFLILIAAVEDDDLYFVQRRDAAGRLRLSGIQKVTAAMRQLAYDTPEDAIDEDLNRTDNGY
jgi:hypothetical protein